MKFAAAQKIADAVLYEGYLLYPYRRSAAKNQARWQFGVLVPRGYSEHSGSDPWTLQTECLLEPGEAAVLHFKVRFLQLQARGVEEATDARELLFRPVDKLVLDGKELFTWEEAVEREVEQGAVAIDHLLSSEQEFSLDLPGGRDIEYLSSPDGQIKGRIVRERWALRGRVRLAAESLGQAIKIRMRVENLSECPNQYLADRAFTLRQSFIATHALLAVSEGAFVSLIDPPEWARDAAAACVNLHTWPVLVGEKGRWGLMLSAPIILYDYPQVAPESPGDLFDLTEIDELLTLSTMALSEDEKQEVRGTDGRGAALLDRVDNLPDEIFRRLHGSVRYFRAVTEPKEAPGWDLDGSVSPETDQLVIGGIPVSKGSRVVLRPGRRPADAQDMFCRGRTAVVEAVFADVEGKSYLAVTLLDDPGADLQRSQKRFRYFYPDEVEPVAEPAKDGR
ncbi:MAG TPA: hypothetical protein VKJ47_05030 [Candidatus Binatia bacterium]|nr:hypothetical protein [Candidatus Binatia bacterium]